MRTWYENIEQSYVSRTNFGASHITHTRCNT